MTKSQFLVPLLAAFGLAHAAAAQQTAPPPAASQAPAPTIVVTGTPDESKNPIAANPRIRADMQIESRTNYNQSSIFVHCAPPDAATLRSVLDGPPNEQTTVFTLGRFVEKHIQCHQHYDYSNHPDPVDLGRSLQGFYDRGAMLEYALNTYQPNLKLKRSDTHKQAIIDRFNAVEQGRNRYRWPEDIAYFKVAICMVQAEPDLAGQMMRSDPGSPQSERIGKTIIARAHACRPDAKRIEVDPTQFRIYVLDAYYRWAEASQGLESLIPGG
ncbi:hypothetical protein FHS31_002829 [Sphingomonas vulcanisoli]|uniref:Uncharacterized protein n=1 Tax=Sphingomonas vulcanisoli TaxID=1658060 RepID=A0ABX0TUK4_9SPHN|nr:hypothetical protein [Sphingomonas vulcanisoli]NIJ09197.1 hypothetical protein [Sphingomonas vulcanisoli]